jgi:hypothetical protein
MFYDKDKSVQLEIAKLIGQPISTQLPVPFEVAAVADIDTVEAGEYAYRYSALDNDADVIKALDTVNGIITVKKRSPLGDTPVDLTSLDSKLEYVHVHDILNSPDTKKLARRKASITRSMDKKEVKSIIDLIEADNTTLKPGEDVADRDPESGEDLYQAIMGMVHEVEDYGDKYTLLIGSDVKEAIDLFDYVKAGTNYYKMSIYDMLAKAGVEVVKVFGQVADLASAGAPETSVDILGKKKGILVAKNSRIAEGKPIKFVRRLINAEIATLMGADVDSAQRAIIVHPTPVIVSGSNVWAYGCAGMEAVAVFISNPKAIVKADLTDVV